MPPPTTIIINKPEAASVYFPRPSTDMLKILDHITEVQSPHRTRRRALNGTTTIENDDQSTGVVITFTGISSTVHQWYSVSDVAILSKDAGQATSIGNVNTDLITPFKIFNLNGQQVRSNATSTKGLTKGIYIINGKKVVVKE